MADATNLSLVLGWIAVTNEQMEPNMWNLMQKWTINIGYTLRMINLYNSRIISILIMPNSLVISDKKYINKFLKKQYNNNIHVLQK